MISLDSWKYVKIGAFFRVKMVKRALYGRLKGHSEERQLFKKRRRIGWNRTHQHISTAAADYRL